MSITNTTITEETIRNYADNVAEFITIRTESGEIKRKSSLAEKAIISAAIQGALNCIRFHNGNSEAIQHAKDTAEFIACAQIPELQGYISVYIPIQRFLDGLENL